MPSVLVGLLETGRAAAHRAADRHGVVRVLREHAREQLRHPALDCVRERVDESAGAKDCCMPLPERACVCG